MHGPRQISASLHPHERVGGVGFDTPQVIRPESHQNRAPPGLGDCKSNAFPLVSHSPQITKIMMRKIIYYYGIYDDV